MPILARLGTALLVAATLVVATPAAERSADDPTSYDYMVQRVDRFNPSLNPVASTQPGASNILAQNSFIGSASEHAEGARDLTVVSFWWFMPFLILPQILLLIAIIKFRDRKDGRKVATFVHNHKLEIVWTAVPILTLIIVSFPAIVELYKVDQPPADDVVEDRLNIDVIGKQFSWKFNYPEYGINLATDFRLGPSYQQESMVFEKDRIAYLKFASEDVNHNWSVPAFGVRKDCFTLPRPSTYAWFTPQRAGSFEGQCYELCGEGHSLMMFAAIVVDKPDFDEWVGFYQNKNDASVVSDAFFQAAKGAAIDRSVEAPVNELKSYLAAGASSTRIQALRYWIALEFHAQAEQAAGASRSEDEQRFRSAGANAFTYLDELLAAAAEEG